MSAAPNDIKLAPKNFQQDKEFAKALHGKASGSSGLGALTKKDQKASEVAIEGYFKHWDGKTDQEAETSRLADYSALTKHYYNLVTDFYEYGWGASFHFCRFYKGEPFGQAVARHEHYLAAKMGITEDMTVLDVGCGVGGPAKEIAAFTGCKVVGLNNNDYQVEKANNRAKISGMEDQLRFVKGDFMQMDFEPESFDAVYAIEATVHAPVLEGVYSEIYKVLKPGGIFGVYEWVMTDKYDENNEEQRKIAYGIEVGDGIPKMYKKEVADQALKNVGFEILYERDLADNKDEIPWWYPLSGEWKYIQNFSDVCTFVRTSYLGRKITAFAVGALETVGLAPKGSVKVTDALEDAAVFLVEGAKQEIFTPMMLYVVRKPLK